MRSAGGELRFSYLMMGVLFLIIISAVLAGIWSSYETSMNSLGSNKERLRNMTEAHIDNSFRLIDTGLKIYDSTYNEEMQEAFVPVMAEYERAGGDPSRMDLAGLKSQIGGMDIYTIDERCVIDHTTKQSDVGLDFRVIYPDFTAYLDGIRNTSGFYPDRVIQDWINGTLTKFSYMPTPDHRYVIELGLVSERFERERMELQYSDVVDEVRAFDPYLEEVLLFQKQKRLVYNTSYVPTPEESAMLDYLLWENRTKQVVAGPGAGRTVVWLPIDLRDPTYSADMSIFAKLTYNDNLLADEQDRVGSLHGLAAVLVILTGAFLSITVSRKMARPIQQLVEDVDAVAGGDLDHAIRPATWYEFSTLAGKTAVMVDRLKEQIRQREASEQRFVDLVQLLPQGVFETDRDGTVTFANPAALEAFGLGEDDLARGVTIFSVITPVDRGRVEQAFHLILGGGKTSGSEFLCLRADGTGFPALVYSAQRLEDGGVAGIRGGIVEISRLKQVEAEVRQLNAALEARVEERTRQLEEAVGELRAFTYSVSHDLRSPLRAIDGYSAMLVETVGPGLEERGRHYLDEIRRTVRQMSGLIDGLLLLSRLDRQELVREEIAVAPLVMEVISVALEQDPGQRVQVTVGDLPPCSADRAMLRQVFANLVDNALKFSRYADEPRAEVGATTNGGETAYFVRDNGVGFDMSQVDAIFRPFQRLHRADRFEGSGIGLATVARIVGRHGGRVWAESAPGEGSTFYFTLPPP